MKEQLIGMVMSFLTGIIIMILHELPKSIIYNQLSEKKYKGIWKLYQYIDPIGLVFCVTTFAGFSRPYMYRIKEKKINMILGITGFFSLFTIFVTSISVLRFQYADVDVNIPLTSMNAYIRILVYLFWYFSALLSCGMILVNLFPVSTFDFGLLIAGKSPSKYFSIIRNDYIIKMVLILAVMLGLINVFSSNIVRFLVTVI